MQPKGRPRVAPALRLEILKLAGQTLTSKQIRAECGGSTVHTTGLVLRKMVEDDEVQRLGERGNKVRWRIVGPANAQTEPQRQRDLAGWPSLEKWESRV